MLMKPLYYLEFAQSIDENDRIIPARKFKWFTFSYKNTAYEDIEDCRIQRIRFQNVLNRFVVRVKKANPIKNISIRINSKKDNDMWIIR